MITKEMYSKVSKTMLEVAKSPHILIAGTTGSGKSVALNNLIYSLLLQRGNGTDFIMIDTKRVELKQYKSLPSLWCYETEPENVPSLLDRVIDLMDDRYYEMEGKETLEPHLYIVIDELADLLDEPGVLKKLVKIGRLGRAAHIHLLACTQDPSRSTLSAQLMQNFTARIALRCRDQIESRQVLGHTGAELLPKYGSAILSDPDGERRIKIILTPDIFIEAAVDAMNRLEAYADGRASIDGVFSPEIMASRDKGSFTFAISTAD